MNQSGLLGLLGTSHCYRVTWQYVEADRWGFVARNRLTYAYVRAFGPVRAARYAERQVTWQGPAEITVSLNGQELYRECVRVMGWGEIIPAARLQAQPA